MHSKASIEDNLCGSIFRHYCWYLERLLEVTLSETIGLALQGQSNCSKEDMALVRYRASSVVVYLEFVYLKLYHIYKGHKNQFIFIIPCPSVWISNSYTSGETGLLGLYLNIKIESLGQCPN